MILFYGCINDEVLDNVTHEHKHRYNTSYTTSDKAKILQPKIAGFNQKHTNRDFEYENLTLKLDKILVLSDTLDNFKSYSILIEKIIPENVAFHVDNLHVFEKDELLFEDFIIRWIPANPEEKIDLKTYTGIVQKFDVDYNFISENTYNDGILFNQSASYAIYCDIQIECSCNGIPYYCGCTSGNAGCVNVLYVSCSGGGGGNSGDGVGNSGEGSGLGGEGGGGSTIGTDGDPLHPFVPNVLEFVENEPCDKLKDLLNTSKTNLKPWINNLKPKLNLVGEHGVIFRKNDLNQYGATYVPYDPELNDNEIFLKVGGDIYCAVHTHPSYTQPMFSWSDVLHLYNIQKNIKTHNSGLATFLVLCKDDFGVEQLYSISVNNISQFMNKIESIINSEEYLGCDITDVQKILDEKIERRFNLENNYERQFLKMFQSFNMTVAKANSQLTSWSVLSVNPLSPSIIAETPCN